MLQIRTWYLLKSHIAKGYVENFVCARRGGDPSWQDRAGTCALSTQRINENFNDCEWLPASKASLLSCVGIAEELRIIIAGKASKAKVTIGKKRGQDGPKKLRQVSQLVGLLANECGIL